MKKYLTIILTAMTALVSMACSGTSKVKEVTNKESSNMKAIVIYFSHAGENYSVGNIKEGNTKLVADMICEQTGADRFEIVAEKSYDMAYAPLCDLAKEEQQKGELPAFKGGIDNIDDYDTIFIGGPIWWGTYPQVMFTFFSKYDLNGKTIIPFTTHEGSGLGSAVSDLKKAYPNATFKDALSIYGHDVRTSGKKSVEGWLKKLGM